MNRTEYMNADTLTDGVYDGRKGSDNHAAYFSQWVNSWHINAVLSAIGKEALLASRDYHLNDIALEKWDRLPMTGHIAAKAKEYGDLASLATKVCVYKQAARMWLESNGGAKKWPIMYTYPGRGGDGGPMWFNRGYAMGDDAETALFNFQARNRGTVGHKIGF